MGGAPNRGPVLIPDGNYVWAGPAPLEQPLGPVQKVLIDEMKKEGWLGMVRVNNIFYSVLPETSAMDRDKGQDGNRGGTVTQCIRKLGLRQNDQFGPNYERMGIEVMTGICSSFDSVEQYVKLTHVGMKDDLRAGPRPQYRELLDSAQTVDLLVKQYAESGRSQDDLKMNDILEIHVAKIALHDSKNRTSNHTGAYYISGRGAGLQLDCYP